MKSQALLLLHNALLATVYVAVASAALELDAMGGFVALVWPPTGIALAAILLGGYRLAPGVALGALLANLVAGASPWVACGIAVGNVAEAVLGAYGMRRFGVRPQLLRLHDVLGLIVIAALASTLVSATAGVLSLWAGGFVDGATFLYAWHAWWLGDMMGALVVGSLLLTWSRTRLRWNTRHVVEAAVMAATFSALGAFIFHRPAPHDASAFAQPYLLFPLIIWAALRFELRGATGAVLLIMVTAVGGTSRGLGPFVQPTLTDSLIFVQVFMATAALTALILGAVVLEREAAMRENAALLQQAHDNLRAREEFLSVASHELRTPLAALVLQLSVLQKHAGDPDEGDGPLAAERIERAARATQRLAKLVESLLDVSRIQAGRMQIATDVCDLGEVAREVVERHRQEAGDAGCELRFSTSEGVQGRWDRARVQQALGNLLSNAIKYGAGKPVDVETWADDHTAFVAVRDRGAGVEPTDVTRIFARFERAVPTKHYGGLGLGLYIASEIVRAHGGTLRVSSDPGKGACFVVQLPRRAPATGSVPIP